MIVCSIFICGEYSTILAAVIGGIATITVAVISPFITNIFQEKKRSKYVPSAPPPRQNSLYGTWHGVMKQVVGIDKVLNQYTLTIVFEKGTKPISGTMKIAFKVADDEILIGKDNSIEGKVINTIYDGRFLKTDYVNKDNGCNSFRFYLWKIIIKWTRN